MCDHHPDQDLEHSIITPQKVPLGPALCIPPPRAPRQPLIFFLSLVEGCALSKADRLLGSLPRGGLIAHLGSFSGSRLVFCSALCVWGGGMHYRDPLVHGCVAPWKPWPWRVEPFAQRGCLACSQLCPCGARRLDARTQLSGDLLLEVVLLGPEAHVC